MNEKEADAIRKSMYESLLMDENDKIVHWDFDPMRRELREYVDIDCGCDPVCKPYIPARRYVTGRAPPKFGTADPVDFGTVRPPP